MTTPNENLPPSLSDPGPEPGTLARVLHFIEQGATHAAVIALLDVVALHLAAHHPDTEATDAAPSEPATEPRL